MIDCLAGFAVLVVIGIVAGPTIGNLAYLTAVSIADFVSERCR